MSWYPSVIAGIVKPVLRMCTRVFVRVMEVFVFLSAPQMDIVDAIFLRLIPHRTQSTSKLYPENCWNVPRNRHQASSNRQPTESGTLLTNWIFCGPNQNRNSFNYSLQGRFYQSKTSTASFVFLMPHISGDEESRRLELCLLSGCIVTSKLVSESQCPVRKDKYLPLEPSQMGPNLLKTDKCGSGAIRRRSLCVKGRPVTLWNVRRLLGLWNWVASQCCCRDCDFPSVAF